MSQENIKLPPQANGKNTFQKTFNSAANVTCTLKSGGATIKIDPKATEIRQNQQVQVDTYTLDATTTTKSFSSLNSIQITGTAKSNTIDLTSSV